MSKVSLLFVVLISSEAIVFAQNKDNSSQDNLDDIKIQCDCENEKGKCKKEQLDPELAKILFENEKFGALGETRTLTSQ